MKKVYSCFAEDAQTASRRYTFPAMDNILLYKRLNNGAFQWPRSEAQLRLLDPQTFRWLMEGLKIDQPKAIRKAPKKDMF